MSLLTADINEIIVIRKSVHPKRNETLVEYYYRINKQLFDGIILIEIDEKECLKIIELPKVCYF